MRVATVDIGTNTVLLLVAERGTDGVLRPLVEKATITRLGQGVDRDRRLAPEAVARTVACIRDYAAIVDATGVDCVGVVGTSALRDVSDDRGIRDAVQEHLGVGLQVIGGEDEARLTFEGALSGLSSSGGTEAVFDIGGGSTEVVVGKSTGERTVLSYARSIDVGSVRLTERHGDARGALESAARAALRDVPTLAPETIPVGVAGTMTTLCSVALALAEYDPARVHGHVMTTVELRGVVDRLAALPAEARRNVTGMEPKRADVIVAGGVLALALLDRWSCAFVRVSDRGVRWGLAQELASG